MFPSGPPGSGFQCRRVSWGCREGADGDGVVGPDTRREAGETPVLDKFEKGFSESFGWNFRLVSKRDFDYYCVNRGDSLKMSLVEMRIGPSYVHVIECVCVLAWVCVWRVYLCV